MKVYPWQKEQWSKLTGSHTQGRLPHALLLTGVTGAGLEDFASALAQRILCLQAENGEQACGDCRSCVLFQAGSHPDFLEIEPEKPGKAIKVDAIRELVEYVNVTSQYANHKLVIIRPAEAMNRHAANGLLKTLEEPPSQSRIILLAEKSTMLPITIRSRCQRMDFPGIRDQQAIEWLNSRLGELSEQSEELLQLAGGGPLRALELAENRVLDRQMELLEELRILRQQPQDPVKTAKKWLNSEDEVLDLAKQLLGFFAEMSRLKLGKCSNKSTIHKHLQGIVKGLDLVQLVQCYDMLSRLHQELGGPFNLNKQGLLEEFIVYWQSTAEARGG